MRTRLFSLLIAVIAWTGLAVQCAVVYGTYGSVSQTIWIVLGFFTITTNLLVAMVFTAIAAGSRWAASDAVVAGTTLSIVLVGVTYALLLDGLVELSGGSVLANVLLHRVTPVLVPVFWLWLTRKGSLRWSDVLIWAVYPLVYLGYALLRGGATGRYAYPFLNVVELGWGRVLANSVVIAVLYLLAGMGVVWADQRLGARGERV